MTVSGRKLLASLTIAFVSGLCFLGFMLGRFALDGNMLSLLPDVKKPVFIAQAEANLIGQSRDRVIISLSGNDKTMVYDTLTAHFEEKGWLDQTWSEQNFAEIARFYGQYAGSLSTPFFQSIIASSDTYNEWAFQQLSMPSNPAISESFDSDPSMVLAHFLMQLNEGSSGVSQVNGRLSFTFDKQQWLFLVLDISGGAQSIERAIESADEVLSVVSAQKENWPDVQILASGVMLHTAENTKNAKYEMSLFGSISLLAVVVLMLWVFRSVLPFLYVSFVLSVAVLFGITALVWIFDSVHLISFVFGVTLIGIAIDYALHVLVAIQSSSQSELSSKVTRALILGFLTTAIGYFLFVFSPIGVMAQVGVFVAFGLFGALIVCLFLSPPLSSRCNKLPQIPFFIRFGIKGRLWVVAVLCASTLVTLLSQRVTFSDEVSLLNSSSESLLRAELVNQSAYRIPGSLFFFVVGEDVESVLRNEEGIKRYLKSTNDKITVNALSNWLPSLEAQSQSQYSLADASRQGRFDTFESAIGIDVDHWANNQLTLEAFLKSPLKDIAQARLFISDSAAVSVIEVNGASTQQIEGLFQIYSSNLYLYDKAAELSQALGEFRVQVMYWLAAAIVVLFVVVFHQFGWGSAIVCTLLIGAILPLSLWVTQLFQDELNLFNVLALVVSLALAIDYFVFYMARGRSTSNVLAISLSALSSLFVFGLLVMSSTPAVFSFGLTVLLGVAMTFCCAPLVVKD